VQHDVFVVAAGEKAELHRGQMCRGPQAEAEFFLAGRGDCLVFLELERVLGYAYGIQRDVELPVLLVRESVGFGIVMPTKSPSTVSDVRAGPKR
jgi:hypothetical protein